MEQISIYILWMNQFCGFNFFLIFILPTYNVYNTFFIFKRLNEIEIFRRLKRNLANLTVPFALAPCCLASPIWFLAAF